MKTFKRIPLTDHEYLFIIHWSDTTSFKLKRHYSNISGTVHYSVEIELGTLGVFRDYAPDLFYDLEHGNVIDVLKMYGFEEVNPTPLEFKMYNETL